MRQAISIAELAAGGLRTPQSWQGHAEEVASMQPSPDGAFYCRTEDADGRKVTTVAAGNLLASTLGALADGTSEWLVQRLYDFPIGGAAYVGPDLTYVEIVHGSTIGLLRHGELRLAVDIGEDVLSHPSSQQYQWRYRNLTLVREPVPHEQADEIYATIAVEVARHISYSGLEGLFEWGYINSECFFLDLKPLEGTGELGTFLAAHRHPQTCPTGSKKLELPLLGSLDSPARVEAICIARGARLSHAITYKCASLSPTTSLTFESW